MDNLIGTCPLNNGWPKKIPKGSGGWKKEKPIKHKRTQQWGKGEIARLLQHKVPRMWLFMTWCWK